MSSNNPAGALAIAGNLGTRLCWKVVCADLTRSIREKLEKIGQQASVRVLETPLAPDFPDGVMVSFACNHSFESSRYNSLTKLEHDGLFCFV